MGSLSVARNYYCESELRNPATVHTFASLHPGDITFVTAFSQHSIPVQRFENYLDLVPFLPPTESFFKEMQKIPILKEVLRFGDNWDFAAQGTLQYINKQHLTIADYKGLARLREEEILLELLIHGEKALKAFAGAHHIGSGSGYFDGVCCSNNLR